MTCCSFFKISSVRTQLLAWMLFFVLAYFGMVSTSQAIDKKSITLKYNLIGTESWTPYGYSGDDANPGIFAEVIDLILEKAGYSYEFYYYPPKRAAKVFEENQLDIDFMSPSWFKNGDMGDEYVQSIMIFELTEYNVTLQENAEKYADPHAIYDKHVGTIAGYSYFDDDMFTRIDFSTEDGLIRGLKRGRFEVAILENLTARHWAKKHNVKISLASVHSHGDIVLRLRRELSHLLPNLNAAIRALKQEGEIDNILRKHDVIPKNLKLNNE
ncbi:MULTISPECIES: substrate-binding periplasmic protein [Aliiglaciecola]|uniref:substrate-binding periplasmic protein n=1 Tax=Aliiglaciecola TaxID=1406885 RepID=UPI001C095A21|nr:MULTISPECIES: transporter substrate-binding domain-containing protein [Aliiglaciecola]MBU2879014.1 transporter substrate-binding domain-containing protein [Aliiglaciecola lipolytica]MDO6710712.1 transporter substrate-binding domain-containing protein [Aliiglaciecola sp. 2_MG-2023]MDO6751880.1 transporter substrate-binding domain-containing protein [Aliiglaciecola sp. 1_MG-2023]